MQTLPPPRVESFPPPPAPPGQTGRRVRIFFSVFIVAVLIGLAIVYARDPIYRATASVLTVKPKAVDTRSAAADVEHVAIQGRLLLGEGLLGRLSDELAASGIELSVEALRARLSISPVPETNLLELRAEGSIPAELQSIINRWAETYETFRAEEIEALSGRTIAELEEQQEKLDGEIEAARTELQVFRETHDIVSLERGENRSLSSLQGLNASLNKARERLVEAQARQAAVVGALQRGETVVPDAQKGDMTKLRLTLQRAKMRLADLRQKYTERYIELDPVLKELPGEIREMERALASMRQIAQETVVDEANQDIATATAAVETLERQLTEQQGAVQTFTQRFKEFKALEDGLARLETLYADNGERLARIRLRNLTEYPPIQVVDWARLPDTPISPDYERDLFIAIASALALALFVTWLVDYLGATTRTATHPTQLDVHIHTGAEQTALEASPAQMRLQPNTGDQAPARLTMENPGHNESLPVLPRELATSEVQALLGCCDSTARGYATLLLNGVSPYELPLLHAGCFDDAQRQVSVAGASRRTIRFSENHWALLAELRNRLGDAQMPMPVADLNLRLQQAAAAAAVAEPAGANALTLWHSYVLYLIRQGVDAGSLMQRVGALPAEIQGALMHFAPPGGSRPLGSITFDYPLPADTG